MSLEEWGQMQSSAMTDDGNDNFCLDNSAPVISCSTTTRKTALKLNHRRPNSPTNGGGHGDGDGDGAGDRDWDGNGDGDGDGERDEVGDGDGGGDGDEM